MKKQLNVRFTASQDFEIDVTAEEWETIEKASDEGNTYITTLSPAWDIIMDNIDLEDALDNIDEIEVDTYQYDNDEEE